MGGGWGVGWSWQSWCNIQVIINLIGKINLQLFPPPLKGKILETRIKRRYISFQWSYPCIHCDTNLYFSIAKSYGRIDIYETCEREGGGCAQDFAHSDLLTLAGKDALITDVSLNIPKKYVNKLFFVVIV